MEIRKNFIQTGEQYKDIMDRLRADCINYLEDMIESIGGSIDFDEDDYDTPHVCWHPKYAPSQYISVNSVYIKDNQMYLSIDDDSEYSIDRVDTQDIYDIALAVNDIFDDRPTDINGVKIDEGDTVVWTDPETGSKQEYTVFGTPNNDMVKLYCNCGECEALPEECEVIL